MSEKKPEAQSTTFQKIVEEADQKGTLPYAAARLMKDFTEAQKEITVKRAKGLSDLVDRLRNLIESLEEEAEDV